MGRAGQWNGGLAVVGFSLPPQDKYVRQILYSIVTRYQRANQMHQLEVSPTPVKIVDLFLSDDARTNLKDRYRFVDWSAAELYGSGLDQHSLNQIFAE